MEIAALLFFLTQRNSLAITRETPPLFYLIIIYFTYFTFPHFPTLCFRSHYRLHIHKQGYAIQLSKQGHHFLTCLSEKHCPTQLFVIELDNHRTALLFEQAIKGTPHPPLRGPSGVSVAQKRKRLMCCLPTSVSRPHCYFHTDIAILNEPRIVEDLF